MNDIYDFLDEQKANGFQKGEYNPEEYKAQKKEEKDAVYQMIDDAAKEIGKDPKTFKNYLDTQSKFDRYSVANTILIMKQKPDATQLKEFSDWKEMGAYIRRNQKSISILEPHDYVKEDGTPGVGYNVKKVFDISQTTARPTRSNQRMPDERMVLRALIEKAPFEIRVADEMSGEKVDAEFDKAENVLYVKRGLETPEFFRTVSMFLAEHEIASIAESYEPKMAAFQENCVTYMLCEKYGIDTLPLQDVNKLPKSFEKMDSIELRGKLNEMKEAMDSINSRMNMSLMKQRQEKLQEQER